MRPQSVHAVFFALNEVPFFKAALGSVYDTISGATVITQYDLDRYGNWVAPEGLVDLLLSREVDPERKVSLIITTEGKEPTARNRAMDYAKGPRRIRELIESPASIPTPDLFWQVDADEVYDPWDIARLFDFVGEHRARSYRLELRTYFRSWNWRIEERGSFTALTRPSFRFGSIRDAYPNLWRRAWAKATLLGWVAEDTAWRRSGALMVPPDIAVCHHGSYVGSRERIANKLRRSAHATEMDGGWMERVWDNWTPETTNFHPTHPERFPLATHVPTSQLPPAIRDGHWPEGWIEPLERTSA